MKPKAEIEINGETIVMDNFYRSIEELKDLSIIKGKNEEVLAVENLSQEFDLFVLDRFGTPLRLRPGERYSFGSLKPTRNQLTFEFRKKAVARYPEDDEDYGDYND